jgi:hypothetical protein
MFPAVVIAQSKPPATPTADPDFAPIAWMVGGTWVSQVTDLSNDTVTHVENRVRWSPNRKAIQFLVDFSGVPHYNGFYAYNPAAKNISFYYTSSEGELTTGTATADPDGKTVHQEFDLTHTDGSVGHLRSTLVRDGDNAYWLTVFMQKNGDWAQVFHIRYERKPE